MGASYRPSSLISYFSRASVGAVTTSGRRPIGTAAARGSHTGNLNSPQRLNQFLNKRYHHAPFSNAHLFGPGSFLCTSREGIELRHFCLFWQLIGVTISRRCAAGNCADAQHVSRQDGCKMAGERELRRNLTTTHRAIKRARLSACLAIMGAGRISTRLLVNRQQQLGQYWASSWK